LNSKFEIISVLGIREAFEVPLGRLFPLPMASKNVAESQSKAPAITSSNSCDTFNTFFYVAVFCLVGLPIWWMTTTTSRASLPFDQIDQFTTYTRGEKVQLRSHDPPHTVSASTFLKEHCLGYPVLHYLGRKIFFFQDFSVEELSRKWKNFWILPPTTAIDIVFTLVNPTPDKMRVSWDTEEGLKRKIPFFCKFFFLIFQEFFAEFLDPTLSRLSSIANFTVSSQILRYLDAEIITKLDPQTNQRVIEFREAAKVINSVESRLGNILMLEVRP
jgi:hypothetical protein